MNCTTIRSRLLEMEEPRQPSAAVRTHLRECAACAAWQRRLVQIERNVARLPVPLSTGRAAAVQSILSPDSLDAAATTETVRTPTRSTLPEEQPFAIGSELQVRYGGNGRGSVMHDPQTARRRLVVGAAVAAAGLLLLESSWLIVRKPAPEPVIAARSKAIPDPLVALLVDRDLKLASAQEAKDRVQTLADIADDIRGETSNLVNHAESEELMHLARLYDRVVREGVVAQAQTVPLAEREGVLGAIGDQLSRTWHEAETAAENSPAVADSMGVIAKAAHEAGEKIKPKGSGPAAAAASAQVTPSPERLFQLKQNHDLVERLVVTGLSLAAAVDPLKRADVCGYLAKIFASEVGRAAKNQDGARAVELGGHFQDVLKRGVAGNLTMARQQIPPSSTRYVEMRRLGNDLHEATDSTEKELRQASHSGGDEMGEALEAVAGGRAEILRVLENLPDRAGRPATR